MTTEQDRYLISLLDKSEEDLLFEIARDSVKHIRASTSGTRGYEQRNTKSFDSRPSPEQLTHVPTAPVAEELKPTLTTFLTLARKRAETLHRRIYALLCDDINQSPNAMALDIATGHRKDIIAAVATLLMNKYSTEMSLAIPVAVFYLKKGLISFCIVKPTL